MAIIVDIDHDDNTLNEYDATTGVIASFGAKLAGSVAGLRLIINNTNARFGEFDFTQLTGTNMRTRFYLDPNALTMAANNGFAMLEIMDGTTELGRVQLAYVSSQYTIETFWTEDSTALTAGPTGTITDAEHYVEVRWQRATNASSNDGVVELFIDGVSQGSTSTFDVSTIAQPSRIRFGSPVGLDAGTSGTFHLDELVIRDDDTEIGASTSTPVTPASVPPSESGSNISSLIPSFFQSKQIAIVVFEPLVSGGAFLYDNIADIAQGYQHEIRANGGYWSAGFSLSGRKDYIDRWIERGLGRHIEVYNHAQHLIWEGFVNKVSATIGSDNITVGPLLDIGNKTQLFYSSFVQLANGQGSQGVRLSTSTTGNTASQERYGVIERLLSGGGIPQTEAENLRDAYLLENADPRTTQQGAFGGQGTVSVSIECLGYIQMAKAFSYTNATRSTETVTAKIKAVLAADPNALLSSDYVNVSDNTFTIQTYEDGSKSGFDVIQGLGEIGGASDERYTFGLYGQRKAKYAAVPTTVAYHRAMFTGEQAFFTPSGERVEPWDVQPGQWVFTTDIYGSGAEGNLKTDKRFTLIESVSFSLPNALTWTGGRADRLPQRLAKMGISGIGA